MFLIQNTVLKKPNNLKNWINTVMSVTILLITIKYGT